MDKAKNDILPKYTRAPLLVTIFSILAYFLLFTGVHYLYGHAMAISAIVPIIAVGWFYGRKPGIYAGILSFPINILMYQVFQTSPMEGIMLNGGGILGTCSLILIGAVIGRVRDLSIQLKKHHDKLDELVKIKTNEVHLSNQTLTETKDYLDNIIESSLDGITVSDDLGHVTRVNKAFLELIGFEEEEVVGKHIMELSVMNEGTYESSTGELVKINEEFFNTNMEMAVKLYEEGKISHWESYYLRKDGKIVPVEMKIANLYNEHGDNTGAVGISRGITERKIAEKEIKEAKEFLENIFRTTTDGILVTDNEGVITVVNEATVRMLGYCKEEIIGKGAHIFKPEGVEHELTANMYVEKLFKEGTVIEFEFIWLKKDGNFIDLEVNAALLKDSKGNVTGAVTSIRDITERKKAEKELRETKNFLESIIENSRDGILVVDDIGNILSCNTAIEHMSGFGKEKIIGKHASTLIIDDKETRKKILEKTAELFEKGFATYDAKYKSKEGKYLDVECTSSMISNEKGEYIAGVSIIRDISERKKAEHEIREGKEFLEKIIQGSKDGILIGDGKGYILSANEAMEEMLGLGKHEVVGKHSSELLLDDKSEREKVLEQMRELFENGFATYEAKYKSKNSDYVEVECYLSMIKDEKGDYIAGISIVRDITERKQIQQQLIQSEKLRSLGELAGGVAHDFNNVLAAILGRAQLLKMQFKPPPGKQEKRKSMLDLIKSLEIIERASSDGAETVRRIQEFARKRSDDKDFSQVNINELLDNVLEFTGVRWKDDAESKSIKINIQKEFSSLPPTAGSASELREVFTNIINNALDAMPQGGCITIKTSTENNQIAIRIKDTGVGIPEDIRSRIFDPFFTTKGVQSTGLGMSTSYGIINRHKGTIIVNSNEGEGTTFTIKLPLSKKSTQEEGVLKKSEKEHRTAKILVIEDEEEVRQLLYDVLISGGHEVEVASDGNQGLKLFETREFDLVFTDLGMPEMSGWEVAERVKSINSRIPVAIITGWTVELQETEMRERGINLIAHKPFEVNQILSLVQEGMELKDKYKAA